GLGAAAVIAGLFVLPPESCLRAIALLGLLGAGLAALDRRSAAPPRPAVVALALVALATPLAWPGGWLAPRPSPYKGLPQALAVSGARAVGQASSPLASLVLVDSPEVPFRHAPGLSLAAPAGPPPQHALFSDGELLGALTHFDGRFEPLAYLDWQSSAAPYALLDEPSVLVLGAGTGAEVLLARSHGARHITAVELNPGVIEMVRREAPRMGNPFDDARVKLRIAEGRGFVASSQGRHDLIQIALLDAFGASAAGLQASQESYLYTVEAFEAYLARLADSGVLAITRWVKIPPRDSLRLVATAAEALSRAGAREPARHLALIRSFRTATLLVKRAPFTPAEVAALVDFCESRSFDVAYAPGVGADLGNRFNVLDDDTFSAGARALLGPERAAFLDRYKFDLRPATDDRPYFHQFLKLGTVREMLSMRESGGMGLGEWGYLVLLATLAQAALASFLLILLPLPALPREDASRALRRRSGVYFVAIGLAFIAIEMAFIQRFALFLGHPLYSVAVVLAGFLVFAGLGSGASARWRARLARRGLGFASIGGGEDAVDAPEPRPAPPDRGTGRAIAAAVLAIAFLALVYLAALSPLFRAASGWPGLAKAALSLTLIAPLAFFMGMPFPLGLAMLARRAPSLVPWAWGVNGCASVVGAVLATLVAMEAGQRTVVSLACALYLLSASILRTVVSR
ncbi:MAG: SAM-dependent methyltransferase, partial [Deltaproteobacteria bacterium]|nr:SAM-dependent methyltransferase [Deltaproteobacteria bacterium]